MDRASEPDLVDESAILTLREYRMPNEPDPAQEVVDAFLEVTPARLEQLRLAVQHGDTRQVRAIAHQVRGSSGTVGAVGMHQTAVELEACDSSAETEALVKALHDLFDRTRPLLRALSRP